MDAWPSGGSRTVSSRRLKIEQETTGGCCLDGHNTHTQVSFLEACWDRNIVCVILPAHMSNIFRPLDVDFFNTLKLAHHQQVDSYQLSSTAASVPKSFSTVGYSAPGSARPIPSRSEQRGPRPAFTTPVSSLWAPQRRLLSQQASALSQKPTQCPRYTRDRPAGTTGRDRSPLSRHSIRHQRRSSWRTRRGC